MELIGAHMSIAGGVHFAIDRAEQLGCTAFQLFVKSARKLFDKPLDDETIRLWHEKLARSRIVQSVIAHTGYLINLAAPDDEKWGRYIDAMAEEMARCDALGIPHIVVHPGSPHDQGEEWGIRRVAEAINYIYERNDFSVNIALETTAGSGANIGWKFEHLREIIDQSNFPEKLRVAFDTCHAFAAGYDFTNPDGYEEMWRLFDKIIGFDRLVIIHMNDSKHPLGSHKDRHEHIGKGFIGTEPFGMIMRDERLKGVPKVLETPKENDMDKRNLRLLWELAGEEPPVKL